MNANELFQAGDLQGAIAAATADLKAKPTDVAQRLFLAELLWFNGQLDRVEKQLETISMQTTQSAMTLALYRQILRGEVAREQVLREGRTPEIVTELPPDAKSTLEALLALRLGQQAEAARNHRDHRGELAEHRAQSEPLEQRSGDHAGSEQGDDRHEVEAVRRGFVRRHRRGARAATSTVAAPGG